MWFVSYIFFGFMFASWIEPYFPKTWLKMYPDLHNYVSFILVTSVLFYVYFLRPMLKEMNGTKRIGFGKHKGRKWEDLPTDVYAVANKDSISYGAYQLFKDNYVNCRFRVVE